MGSLESAQNTSKYIPLKIIIRYLEQMTCQFSWYEKNQNWVVDMMVSMTGYKIGGKCLFSSTEWSSNQAMITVKELLDVYHQIHTEKDPFWAEQAQQQFYILGSISYLIDKLVVTPMKLTNGSSSSSSLSLDEKAIMSYSLDLICSYLVELQSVTLASVNEKEIIEQLKKLKSTIEFCGVRH